MQRSGTEAARTWTQPSKPKRDKTNIINTKIVKIHKVTYGQQRDQLFSKRWPLSNRNRTKIIETNVR